MKKILLSLTSLSFVGAVSLGVAAIANPVAKAQASEPALLQQTRSSLSQDVIYKQIEMGEWHSGTIVNDKWGNDHLTMWGYNSLGQIGDGTTISNSTPQAITLPENKIKDLSLGQSHSGAITTDAEGNDHLYMWGYNYYGQLGDGTTTTHPTPQAITLPENKIKDLSLGTYHSGAITTDAEGNDHLYIWGSNGSGQLGDGTTTNRHAPQAITLPENKIKDLSLGGSHSGAITTDAEGNDHLYMWGSNGSGQLGDGSTNSQYRPKAIPVPHQPKQLNLGGNQTSAITQDALGNDHLYMWGKNGNGQIGNNIRYDQIQPWEISNYWYAEQIENFDITKVTFAKDYITLDLTLTYNDLNWVNVNQIYGKYISLNVSGYSISTSWNSPNSNLELTGYVTIRNLTPGTTYSNLTLKATNNRSNSSKSVNIPQLTTLPA